MLLQSLAVLVRGELHAAVRVVNEAGCGTLPHDGHVERGKRQLVAEVVGHGPADDAAREQVEHHGQVQPALGGPDVGQVGQPDPVRRPGREVAPEQVRRHREGMRAVRRAAEPALAPGRQAHAAHQARDPLAADPPAMGTQGGMHARAAVAAAAGLVRGADLGRHRAVLDRPRALRPAGPGVVAAAAHAQHLAHDLDGVVGDVIADEGIAHLRPVAWPKMSAAFPKMSRSIRTRSSSRRSRPISAA